MISQKRINEAIFRGIKYLTNEQNKNGSFTSYSSFNEFFSPCSISHSVFSTSLIALSINEAPEAAPILKRVSGYLLKQKSEIWSFNYWERASKEYEEDKYPDDLDDTACAMGALFKIDPSLINGQALAKVVSTLTSLEKKEGGPYSTWIVPKDFPKAWQDIDPAVNSNVAYFLSLFDVRLPSIDKLVESKIVRNKISSPYYVSDIAVIYFISRFYRSKKQKELINILKSKINIGKNNCMEIALAVTALLNFECPPEDNVVTSAIKHLSAIRNKWQPFPLIIEKVEPAKKTTCYSGSPALTCAFVIEALLRYKQSSEPIKTKDEHWEEIFSSVVRETKKQFPATDSGLKEEFVKIVNKVANKEIVLFPQLFASSLGQTATIPSSFLNKLSLANLFGWIAYSIYDDFLDQEGDPPKLAIANICLRRLNEIFQSILPDQSGFYALAKSFLDQIDAANYWETTNCRMIPRERIKKSKLPKYINLNKLAEKSIGHALGPIAILYQLGLGKNSDAITAFIEFAKNYLIARQLNDDAHDWESDIKLGHISYPVVQVAKDSGKTELVLRTEKDLWEMKSIFWNSSITKICHKIFSHSERARKSLDKLTIVSNKETLLGLILPLENSAREALVQRKKVLEFINETDGSPNSST